MEALEEPPWFEPPERASFEAWEAEELVEAEADVGYMYVRKGLKLRTDILRIAALAWDNS